MPPEIVTGVSPSGAAAILKSRIAIDFGSIPAPFVKEVTAPFVGADAADGVTVSAAQALAAGVGIVGARVSATGVVAISIATTGGTTVTPNTVTLDVYVTKGGASA